jgi:lipopolysaccharide/colanic/teichoic acid biosynthesis glycosyltransferase
MAYMLFFSSRSRPGALNPDEPIGGFSVTRSIRDGGIHTEDQFNEMLTLERKRSERSKKPFILMLLEMKNLPLNGGGRKLTDTVTSTLISSTREIDVTGWYKYSNTLGVLFTELGEGAVDHARERILDRVYNELCRSLSREQLQCLTITFHVYPEDLEESSSTCRSDLMLYPDLIVEHRSKTIGFSFKRVFDIVGSLSGLVLLSPLFIVVSALIKLTSKGPVFYKQTRVGQFGREFLFLKFRSMVADNDPTIHKQYIKNLISLGNDDAEKGNNGVYKIKDDPRVTSIGKFIRKTSIDELPQLLNVLKGEMSLVGPRPPIPYELEYYQLWHKRRILEMKPGITGLWQVFGRSQTTFDEMVRLDLRYTKEWSLWLDINLLLRTPWVVLSGKGAY